MAYLTLGYSVQICTLWDKPPDYADAILHSSFILARVRSSEITSDFELVTDFTVAAERFVIIKRLRPCRLPNFRTTLN